MKTYKYIVGLIITLSPALALAADPSLQKLLTNIPKVLSSIVIPFLFGIAFLIFVYNVLRYFIIEGNNEKGREKAKALAIYSLAAFVFLIIFFGIVEMFTKSTGLEGEKMPCPDYFKVQGKCP